MAVRLHAVGVFKVGVLQAQLGRLVVHHLHKIFDGGGRVLCQHVGRVVAAHQHSGVEGVLQTDLLARQKARPGRPRAHGGIGRFADRDRAGQVAAAVFHGQGQRHHLGNTGWIIGAHAVVLQQHLAGVRIQHQVGGRRHFRGCLFSRRTGRQGKKQQ